MQKKKIDRHKENKNTRDKLDAESQTTHHNAHDFLHLS